MTLKGQMLISFDFSFKQKDLLDIGGPSGLDYMQPFLYVVVLLFFFFSFSHYV